MTQEYDCNEDTNYLFSPFNDINFDEGDYRHSEDLGVILRADEFIQGIIK